jgi:hypothetical protein
MRGSHTTRGGFFASLDAASVPVPNAGDVIDRMREVLGLSSDVELAEQLKLGRTTPGMWRLRNRVPTENCVEVAAQRGVSLDWLIFGTGEAARGVTRQYSDDAGAMPGHVVVAPLRGFGDTPGAEPLVLPELLIRQRGVEGDLGSLRYMINPTDGLSPRLPKGRILLVDAGITRHEDVVDGETYVVRMWDRVNVRRIFIIGRNEYRLRGDSEHEERRDLTGPDYQHLAIGGRVIDAI